MTFWKKIDLGGYGLASSQWTKIYQTFFRQMREESR